MITIDAFIDDARRTDAFGLLMSLNMLIEFGDAFGYTARDFTTWCQQVGFHPLDNFPLQEPPPRQSRASSPLHAGNLVLGEQSLGAAPRP